MDTQTFTETLVVVTCGHVDCEGSRFGMSRAFYDARREDHGAWYCPRGHRRYYVGKSDTEQQAERADEAERQLRFARSSAQAARDQRDHAYRSAAAYKGHATRILNMVANGVCPVAGCRRNFENVREHMATMHPDYHQHEVTA